MIPVVLAYKRPELTQAVIEKLLEIGVSKFSDGKPCNFPFIALVQDGLRQEENEIGVKSYRLLTNVLRAYASINNSVHLLKYSKNLGLTNHLFRILEDIHDARENVVFIEEDKFPTIDGLEFIKNQNELKEKPIMVDTLPFQNHPNALGASINTLFTDNGNFVLSQNLRELSKELWIVKDRYQREFEKNLMDYLRTFNQKYAQARAFSYFRDFFTWGLFNPDRPDSLFVYALILSRQMKTCPTRRLSDDNSDKDNRGKNVNYLPKNRNYECSANEAEVWESSFCVTCEKQGLSERVGITPVQTISNSFKFRIKNWNSRF